MSLLEPRYVYSTEPDFGTTGTYTPQPQGQPAATPVPVDPPTPASPASTALPARSFAVALPRPTPRRAPTNLPVPNVESAPRYSSEDYAAAAHALLPRGRVWPDDPDSVQYRVMGAIGAALARVDASATAILSGAIPGAPTARLPEWEATLGLPDADLDDPTIANRLGQVRARFVSAGGQSRQRYIDFAKALGFTIQIRTFKPGQSHLPPLGIDPYSSDWLFVWGVRVLANSSSLTPAILLRELDAIKPAESIVTLL